MNRVTVTPMPAEPNTINIPIVDLNMPNSPKPSLPNNLAHTIPDNRMQNFPEAVPVSDQNAP